MEPGILIRPSTIGMILISIIGVPVFAQTNGNITTPVVPQGTSLDMTNDSSAENLLETSSGNITTPVVPQGASLNVSEDITSSENQSTTTSGNITTPVVPQGTSLEITNDSLTEKIPQTGAGNIQEPIAPG
jgi:hypothetical protein